MSAPRAYDPLPPSLSAAPEARTGAGSPVTIALTITNRATEPRVIALATLGVDAEWLPKPSRSRPVMPGESIVADLTLSPSVGTVPARYPLAVAVQALDPVEQHATSVTAVSEIVLVVDAPGQVDVAVEPAAPTAVFGKRMRVLVKNSGMQPENVHLEVRAPYSMRVHLADDRVEVPPGQTVSMPGYLKVARASFWGTKRRNTYTITARSAGAPKHTEAAFTARPILGPFGTKIGLVSMVLVLWIALAVVFIPKLADKVRTTQAAPATKSVTSTAPAKPGANGNGGSGGNGNGSTGTGGSGGGSNGGGGKKGGGGKGAASPAAAKNKPIQINGAVTSDSPGGVNVDIHPTSLVDEEAEGAQSLSHSTDTGPVGKIPESAVVLTAPAVVSKDQSMTTHSDGTFGFTKIKQPGYYLLTLSKPGYQTVKYVIDSSSAIATQPLKVALVAGSGHLEGTVRGPKGLVPGAQITITDGTNTITTSSNSKGAVGHWSVDGLSTPSSYLVSASSNGLSTESQLVDLAAGGTATVNLGLHNGVATLSGTIRGVGSTGGRNGIGSATVTAVSGSDVHTATTVTSGSLRGHYVLSDLAPGTYNVTIEAEGYLTQTKQLVIRKNASAATVDASLNPSSAIVTGDVRGPGLGAIVGAGLMLVSKANTYKITSGSRGAFRFNGVAPGTYTISAEYFDRVTSFRSVKAVVGKTTKPVHFVLATAKQRDTATIVGFAGGATSSGGTLGCNLARTQGCTLSFTLTDSAGANVPTRLKDGDTYDPIAVATAAKNGPTSYRLSAKHGLPAGLYHLTIGSPGYLPATVGVQVPHNRPANAPQVNLYPANVISGTIDALGDISKDGNPADTYTNCVWAIPTGGTKSPPTTCPPSGSGPDQSECTTLGRATANVADLTGKSYEIKGLCDGTYDLYVVITNPAYDTLANAGTQTVSHGQTADYSPHVPRYGRVVLSFQDVDGKALTGQRPVTATCNGSPADINQPESNADGTEIVWGVPAPTTQSKLVTCSVDSGTGAAALHGQVTTVKDVSDDHDSSATILLAQQLNPLAGRVITSYGSSSSHPVPDATVTIKGITEFDGTQAKHGTVTVHTDANGCFAIVPSQYSGPIPSGSCGAAPTGNAVGELTLVDPQLDNLTVDATTQTQSFSGKVKLDDTGQDNDVTVLPQPAKAAPLRVAVDPASPAGADGLPLSQTDVTITAEHAVGHGSLHGQVGASDPAQQYSGPLMWTDGNLGGTGDVWPGTYLVSVHLDGYADGSAEVDCPAPGADCRYTGGLLPTLHAKGALSGTVTGVDRGTGATQVLDNATVIACPGTLTTCTGATSGSFLVKTDPSGKYSFADSRTHYFMAPGEWTLTVVADGYDTSTTPVTIAGGDQDRPLSVDALGSLKGRISGTGFAAAGDTTASVLGPVPNATVTATCVKPSGAATCPSGTISANTDPSGDYTLPGAGSLVNGTWSLRVEASGYTTATDASVTVSGTSTANESVEAFGRLTGTAYGEDSSGAQLPAIPNATVVASCRQLANGDPCPSADVDVTTTADISGFYSFPTTGTDYVLDPAAEWRFTVSGSGFSPTPNDGISIRPGVNAADLHATAWGAVNGVVYERVSAGPTTTPVAQATVTAKCQQLANGDSCPSGANPPSTVTDTSGGFSFTQTGASSALIPGSWDFTVTATGYSKTITSVTVVSGANSPTVYADAWGSLSGTISGSEDTAPTDLGPVSGATVTATCVMPASPADPCSKTPSVATTTDINGDYSLPTSGTGYPMVPGTWKLKVQAGGFVTTTYTGVTVNSGANTQGESLPALGGVSGTVHGRSAPDLNGNTDLGPLNGASVTLTCNSTTAGGSCPTGSLSVTTGPDGTFSIGFDAGRYSLPLGSWTLAITADGYTGQSNVAVTVGHGANVVPVDLDALGTLDGTVSDSKTSNGLTSATLTLQRCDTQIPAPTTGDGKSCATSHDTGVTTGTDTSGRFLFSGQNGIYSIPVGYYKLTGASPGYLKATAVVHVLSGSNSHPLTLDPVASITGTVTDAGGDPLFGAMVVADLCSNSPPVTDPADCTPTNNPSRTVYTDGSGLFTVVKSGGLTAGSWRVTITDAGYQAAAQLVIVSQGPSDASASLDAYGSLSGKIKGSTAGGTAKALSGATVTAEYTGSASDTTTCTADELTVNTNSNGVFTIADASGNWCMQPGTWTITVTATGYADDVETGVQVDGGTNAFNRTLGALGGLSGTITGCVDSTTACTSHFVQTLSGANVSAHCLDCPGPDPADVTTGVGGDYAFGTTANPFVLLPGTWQLTVTDFGYQDKTTTTFQVTSGDNAEDVQLSARSVDLPIAMRATVNGKTANTCALSLTITRTDETSQTWSLDGSTDCDPTAKTFSVPGGLVPATYSVAWVGDSSAVGQSIVSSSGSMTVPFADPDTDVGQAAFPLTIIQNKVKGTVEGPVGTDTAAVLQHVPVELGHLDPAGSFVPDHAANGDLLTASTNSSGVFTITGVPNFTDYVARYNHGSTALNGYVEQSPTDSVSVAFNQTATLPTVTLDVVMQQVTVELDTDTNDDIAGATGTLTSQDATPWTAIGPNPATKLADGQYQITFNNVPFGCWTFQKSLPTGHPGAVSLTSSTGTDPAATCSSGFAVQGTGNGSNPVTRVYQVREHELTVKVTAVNRLEPSGTGPTSATASTTAGTTSVSGLDVPLDGTPATAWVRPDQYTVHLAVKPATAWAASADVDVDLTDSGAAAVPAPEADFSIDEQPATLAIGGYPSSGLPNNRPVTFSLTCDDGQTYNAGCAAGIPPDPATGTSGTAVTFTTGLSPGNWTVTMTWTDNTSTDHVWTATPALSAGKTTTVASGDWTASP